MDVDTEVAGDTNLDLGTPADDPAPEPVESPESSPPPQDQKYAQIEREAQLWRQQAENNARQADQWREHAQASQQRPQAQYDPLFDENLEADQRIAAAVQGIRNEGRMQAAMTNVYVRSQMDDQAFQAQLDRNPNLRRFEQDVQQEYAQLTNQLLQSGRPDLIPSRIRLLHERAGRETITRGARAKSDAEDKARQNIARQTTKPSNPGSNIPRRGGQESPVEAARRRLREAGGLGY